jgi:hypothetical protein
MTAGDIHGPFPGNFRGGCCLPPQFHFNARFLCPLSCSTKVMREIKRPVLEIIPLSPPFTGEFTLLHSFALPLNPQHHDSSTDVLKDPKGQS